MLGHACLLPALFRLSSPLLTCSSQSSSKQACIPALCLHDPAQIMSERLVPTSKQALLELTAPLDLMLGLGPPSLLLIGRVERLA